MIVSRNNPISNNDNTGASKIKQIGRIVEKNVPFNETQKSASTKVPPANNQNKAHLNSSHTTNVKRLTEIQQVSLKTQIAINAYVEASSVDDSSSNIKTFTFDGYA